MHTSATNLNQNFGRNNPFLIYFEILEGNIYYFEWKIVIVLTEIMCKIRL